MTRGRHRGRDMSWPNPAASAILDWMWSGFDSHLRREFEIIRQMVALRHQTPTREWPMLVAARPDVLLVVREWPDGSVTAYVTSVSDSPPRATP
jgi:hypothetical protein